jgi:hypothetical protein
MAIPTPQERPDLYDGYDGLPEGHTSSVELSPRLREIMNNRDQAQAKPAESSDPAA